MEKIDRIDDKRVLGLIFTKLGRGRIILRGDVLRSGESEHCSIIY